MFSRLWQYIRRVDRLADAIAYWLGGTLLGGLWAIMTWLASHTAFIAEQGWGAIGLAGILVLCVLAFAVRALWPVFVYFRPPATPTPEVTAATPTARHQAEKRSDPRLFTPLLHILSIQRARLGEDIVDRWIKRAPTLLPLVEEIGNLNVDNMKKRLSEFEFYYYGADNQLRYTEFGHDYISLMHNIESTSEADVEGVQIPDGLPWFDFRKWFIARAKVEQTIKFLEAKKLICENNIIVHLSEIIEQEQNLRDRQG